MYCFLQQGREGGETTLQDIDKVLHDINSDIASNLNNLLSKAVQYTNNTLNTTTTTTTDPVVIHSTKYILAILMTPSHNLTRFKGNITSIKTLC